MEGIKNGAKIGHKIAVGRTVSKNGEEKKVTIRPPNDKKPKIPKKVK
jgi:hypothetical protein